VNHRKHEHEVLDTSHIRNVHYLATHDLIRCLCGYYGWIKKEPA
jgi:hypothetical protein